MVQTLECGRCGARHGDQFFEASDDADVERMRGGIQCRICDRPIADHGVGEFCTAMGAPGISGWAPRSNLVAQVSFDRGSGPHG